MPFIKTKLAVLLSLSSFATAFAGQATIQFQLKGQWWQSINMSNVTAASLGLTKNGGPITIITPYGAVSSGWGSLTLAKCNTTQQDNSFISKCYATPNSWSNTLSFGISGHAPNTQETATVTIQAGKPLNSAVIKIQLPKKPDFIQDNKLADIIIKKNGVIISEIKNQAWGSSITKTVSFANPSENFEIQVPTIDQAIGHADPATFTLSNHGSEKVNINYTAPVVTKGSADITIKSDAGLPSAKPEYELLDNNNNIISQGNLNWGQDTIINNLPGSTSGVVYNLETPSFISENATYTAIGGNKHAISIFTNKVTPIKISYHAAALPTENLTLNVNGLPNNNDASVITLQDQKTQQNYQIKINGNGIYKQEIPMNKDNWQVTAPGINDYTADVTPNSFPANTASQDVNIKYEKVTPNKLIAATYWSAWGYNTSYNVSGKQIKSQAIELDKINPKYNVIIVAFITYGKNGHYKLDTRGYYTPQQIKTFVTNAEARGKKVLVSLGGATFSWGHGNLVQDVENIISEYNFQGLDIDLEGSAIDPNQAGNISAIVKHFRSQNPNFWLTAAPEWPYIVPFASGSGKWASHALANDNYIQLIKNIGLNNFSYIWPQTYNQGASNGVLNASLQKITPVNIQAGSAPEKSDMGKFLATLTWAITTKQGFEINNTNSYGTSYATKINQPGILIPANKLVLGIPATEGAAGGDMTYIATPELIKSGWALMKAQHNCAAGFMDWSVDWDALNITNGQLSPGYSHTPWATVDAIASLASKT